MKNKILLRCVGSAIAIGATFNMSIGQNKLTGRAVLPAATFAAGASSGKYIGKGPIAGQAVPFSSQPVQGFSALIDNHDGTYMAMPDNGYGTMENSADFYLRVYRIKPEFKTAQGGNGSIQIVSFIEFNDKDNKIPFSIVNSFTGDRKLTGADFDLESIQRASDSTFWLGEEFGPYLLHFDKTGKLMEAPIQLPDFSNPGKFVRSPQNQFNEESSAVRLMNAYKAHAQMNGNTKTPVFSPNAALIDDSIATTGPDTRKKTPVGLDSASTNIFNVSSLKSAGYPVVAWTVNDSATIMKLLKYGVNGIISDYPDLLVRLVSKYDKDGDSKPDFLDADGLIDITKFDAQAHRGGRGLRPENTLPSFENGLDNLVTTLEFDCGISADGIPVISHDPHIQFSKAYRTDNVPYMKIADEVLIKDLTLAELQSKFVLNKLLGGTWVSQNNDTTLSPVSIAFTKANNFAHTYTIPNLKQVFDFADFYVEYYSNGAGKSHPKAALRAKNAARVRFNVETKYNPRTDNDDRGVVFNTRTFPADSFATKIAKVIIAKDFTNRADIQSFAFQTLLKVQKDFPMIRTVYLFTDSPVFSNGGVQSANDGGNLQPLPGEKTSLWLGGLYWPYRKTTVSNSFRAKRSGGFEGNAMSVNKDKLYPLLELPLVGDDSKTIWLHEFDLATKTYTGKRYKYKFTDGTNIGEFNLFNEKSGLVTERDNNQGPAAKVKKVYKVTMNTTDTLTKTLVVDLMDLQDANNLSSGLTTLANDYGVGTSYKFPYQTIESIVIVDSSTVITINDNNYPFSVGRHTGNPAVTTDDITDDNEMIMIKLDASNNIGHVFVTGTEEVYDVVRLTTAISNYPNPFANTTTLSITLANTSNVKVIISNMMGEIIDNLDLGRLNEGFHNIDLKNCSGLKNGVYTIRMKADDKEFITRAVKTN